MRTNAATRAITVLSFLLGISGCFSIQVQNADGPGGAGNAAMLQDLLTKEVAKLRELQDAARGVDIRPLWCQPELNQITSVDLQMLDLLRHADGDIKEQLQRLLAQKEPAMKQLSAKMQTSDQEEFEQALRAAQARRLCRPVGLKERSDSVICPRAVMLETAHDGSVCKHADDYLQVSGPQERQLVSTLGEPSPTSWSFGIPTLKQLLFSP